MEDVKSAVAIVAPIIGFVCAGFALLYKRTEKALAKSDRENERLKRKIDKLKEHLAQCRADLSIAEAQRDSRKA